MTSPPPFAATFLRGFLAFSLLILSIPSVPAQEILTNQSVIAMVRTLNEETILDLIRLNKSNFATGSEDLLALKRAGVGDRIIQAIVSKSLAPAKPEAPKSKFPQDNGVYYKKGDGWVEVLTETMVWTHSGMVNTVRTVASVGMLKPDYNGLLEQASSRTMLTSPFELLIVANNADIHNFLLIPLKRTKNGSREVEMGPAKKGEAFRHSISYGVEKVGSGQYKLVFPSPLAPGEYGIVERSQIATETESDVKEKARVHTFRVLL